jgi:hypothetical protein
VTTVLLYALPGPLLFCCWAVTAWKCHTRGRALARERVHARLDCATLTQDTAALQAQLREAREKAAREAAVLAAADAVFIRAALTHTGPDLPRGGTDG